MSATSTIAPTLHSPTAIHGLSIVYFDGVCGMCNVMVNFLMRIDRQARLSFSPLQGETASQQLPGEDIASLKSIVFQRNGKCTRKSSALVRVLWTLGGLWRVLGILLWIIPKPLRDWGYLLVANNRYAFFGKKETCRLPTPEERARFLP